MPRMGELADQSVYDPSVFDVPTEQSTGVRWPNAAAEALQPTSNYVVFDPGIVDIMKKYGIAGAAPAGLGALAAQDNYRGD